jgi:hypothetical protein
LSNWEARKEEAGKEEIEREREVESLGARFQSPRIAQQSHLTLQNKEVGPPPPTPTPPPLLLPSILL